MSDQVFGPVNQAVQSAKLLSGLDSCTIWALISFGALGYIAWSKKQDIKRNEAEAKNNEAWRGVREKQLASEAAQTEVLRQMTTELASMKLMLTKYLIKE